MKRLAIVLVAVGAVLALAGAVSIDWRAGLCVAGVGLLVAGALVVDVDQ